MNTRSRALAWDPTTAIEALAAADAALWIWTPADDLRAVGRSMIEAGRSATAVLGPKAAGPAGAAFTARLQAR